MNAEPFILTGAAAGLLVGLTGRLFRPELRTRRAGAAMDRAVGPVGNADPAADAAPAVTGLLDRPALYGVLAEIEALGLDLPARSGGPLDPGQGRDLQGSGPSRPSVPQVRSRESP